MSDVQPGRASGGVVTSAASMDSVESMLDPPSSSSGPPRTERPTVQPAAVESKATAHTANAALRMRNKGRGIIA
jgi:hypothetical protein